MHNFITKSFDDDMAIILGHVAKGEHVDIKKVNTLLAYEYMLDYKLPMSSFNLMGEVNGNLINSLIREKNYFLLNSFLDLLIYKNSTDVFDFNNILIFQDMMTFLNDCNVKNFNCSLPISTIRGAFNKTEFVYYQLDNMSADYIGFENKFKKEVLNKFFTLGFDISKNVKDYSYFLSRIKSPVILEEILKGNNIDINAKDINGNTFLHLLYIETDIFEDNFVSLYNSVCCTSFEKGYILSKNNIGITVLDLIISGLAKKYFNNIDCICEIIKENKMFHKIITNGSLISSVDLLVNAGFKSVDINKIASLIDGFSLSPLNKENITTPNNVLRL